MPGVGWSTVLSDPLLRDGRLRVRRSPVQLNELTGMSTSLVSSSNALARAAEAFRDTEWESFEGFTLDKVLARATVVSYEGGRLVFEVERHRSVLGGSYSPGRRMSAFETYWPRFAYDVETGALEELESERESEIEVDGVGLALEWAEDYSFDFQRDDDARCIAKEMSSGIEASVESEEDVAAFASGILSADVIEALLRNTGEVKGHDIKKVAGEISEELNAELKRMALDEWRRYCCDDK